MAHKHEKGCACSKHMTNEPLNLEQLDAGGRSLAEALRLSFGILKIIMVILVLLFLGSGIFMVEEGQVAIVLRFGKFVDVKQTGLAWSLPYPIDERVIIPLTREGSVKLDDYWYYLSDQDKAAISAGRTPRVPRELNPIKDGYTLVRNDLKIGSVADDEAARFFSEGSDYNIVHSKWRVNYRIDENRVDDFFRNVFVRPVSKGEVYANVVAESVEPFIRKIAKNVVVSTLVNFSIDDILRDKKTQIANLISSRIQKKLDKLETGIIINSVQLDDAKWPRQVNDAFNAFTAANQQSEQLQIEARSYRYEQLTAAGGPAAIMLFGADASSEKDAVAKSPDQLTEKEWNMLTGQVQRILSDAEAYKTEVVESARANASYFEKMLPEYRKYPRLVVQRIHQDAVSQVFANAREKIFVQPAVAGAKRIFRVEVNSDPEIVKKGGRKAAGQENQSK